MKELEKRMHFSKNGFNNFSKLLYVSRPHVLRIDFSSIEAPIRSLLSMKFSQFFSVIITHERQLITIMKVKL